MIDVEVPKLNNNDTSYELVQWLVEDGAEVAGGQPLVVVETSKAIEELESPGSGVLHIRVEQGGECKPGESIGQLLAPGEEPVSYRPAEQGPSAAPAAALVVTDAARDLADMHAITEDELRSLNRTLIRTADVQTLVDTRAAQPAGLADDAAAGELLPARQRAVGAAVSESMRTIPAAAAYVKVLVDAALARAERLAQEQGGGFAGLAELLVKAVATLHPRHPMLFGTLVGDGRVRRADAAHVGVTLDVGRGLHVPVIHDAAELSVAQIAQQLGRLRFKALRGGFAEAELAGANVLVALHNTGGVVLATPIVFPGQACAVCLPDTQEELALSADGRVVARRYVNLGLVYDHRLVNGRDAVVFLQELRNLLEAPEELA
ncbi:2-oxo acid dehydrogenase subunit E2 [Actinospica robiniae]|uniref:2-oxo acid dehydrogenase subunit E2 n=1 Tax=Actinospica robiniae TaxID=304901 RepID=UPI00041F8B4C|nr:2-oxo acid dehydrogenase subunit E2 [Actinospica robiniae]